MIKAHQIKLNPTKSQEIFFRKSCGVAEMQSASVKQELVKHEIQDLYYQDFELLNIENHG